MSARTPSVMRPFVAVALAAMAASCGGGGARVATPSSAPPAAASSGMRAQLEGEWTLISLDTTEGPPRRVTGYLRYDRFATLTLRAEVAADDPSARAPQTVVAAFTAKASPGDGEFEYVGLRDDVGAERLTPDAVAMAEWRYFAIDGDTLRVFVRDRAGRAAATLVFQRTR